MATLTTTQAAARLGITARRVRQMIQAGALTAHRVGRDWLIEERALTKVAVRKVGRPRAFSLLLQAHPHTNPTKG